MIMTIRQIGIVLSIIAGSFVLASVPNHEGFPFHSTARHENSFNPSSSMVQPENQSSGPFRQIFMMTPRSGWAITGDHLLWTHTNEYQWRNVTPHPLCSNAHLANFFSNAQDGLVAIACGKRVVMYRTTSGGKSWTTWSMLPIHHNVGISLVGSRGDPRTLWFEVVRNVGMGSAFFDLYRSKDAGRRWTMVASTQPPASHITRLSPQGDVTGFSFDPRFAPLGKGPWVILPRRNLRKSA